MAKSEQKDKKQFRGQYDDEEVLYAFRKHPVVMRKGLIIASLGLLVGPLYVLAVSFIKPSATPNETQYLLILLVGFIFAAILMFPSWIYWYFTVYIMTDQRFIQQVQKGFFKRSYSDIALKHVQSLNYEVYGIQETLLGFGSLMIQTYLGDIVIRDVHHPEKITNALFEILREHGAVIDEPVNEAESTSRNNH